MSTCIDWATPNLPLWFILIICWIICCSEKELFWHQVIYFSPFLSFSPNECPLQWIWAMLDGNFSIVCGSVAETILCLVSSGYNINRSHTIFFFSCGTGYFYILRHDEIFEEQISHSASRTGLSEVCHKIVLKLFTWCGACWEQK